MAPPHALFPGTFDPPTLGHLDLARRAAALFGRVTVGVADHATKTAVLPAEERVALLEAACAGLEGVRVVRIEGLVVDAAERLGATVLVRGVRNGTDFDYELEMARTNRALRPAVDTVLLAPAPELGHVSGTLVRQIASLGGDVTPFVPAVVAEALRRRFARP